ncbi:MAG TPA: helix-turn-helix domain-containing protein [Candidatus Micrarchaeota archaeon]|nr:helix-turn-helix domain-containing protein [Candidatus Micrarchaeota archaeon]
MAGETETLEELGLTANEAKLYLILVRSGKLRANELAAKSGMQRRTVYDTLAQLERKGLAGKADINGVLAFTPAPPSSLITLLEEKRNGIEKILPSLSREYEGEGKSSVSVVYGVSGMKTMLEDIISLNADFCVYYGQLQIFDYLPKYFPIFNEKRKRLGIRAKYILLDTPQSRERSKLIPLANFKFIDPSSLSAGVWWTYADRLILFILEKEPIMIFIKNADLAKTFRKTFDELFESHTAIYRGMDGMKAVLELTLGCKDTYFIGGFGMAPKLLPEYFEARYNKEAIKRGIKWWNIAHRYILKTPAVRQPFHKIRFLPKQMQANPSVIWIFGDYVANVLWLKEPVAFLVQDKNIAKAYKEYFNLLWGMTEEK